ncbi:MAG TPA: NAD(P)-dependent alcohol dehydrogenase [Xanthobacteraceae bacterium]|jgi:NADPH:quinone reductase-like Zn-dependent oxidoreductase
MRVYAFTDAISLESLHLVERPDPTPGPHDIIIRMRAAALNFRDMAMLHGNYHVGVSPPLIPLSDGAGDVIAIGAAVTRFRVGDLVCPTYLPDWHSGPIDADRIRRRLGGPTDGVLTEFMRVHEAEAVRAPSHLDATQAAALPVVAATAWRVLYRTGSLRPGETLLVQGAGAISTTALQLAKAGGARTIAVLRDDRHADALKGLGADLVLTNGNAPTWPQQVREATGGLGADVAINVAGGKTLTGTVAATKLAGIVHLVGFVADPIAELDLFEAIRHGTTFHTATAGSREDFETFVRTSELHGLRPAIAKVFTLGELRDAVAYLGKGGHYGKVALTLDF